MLRMKADVKKNRLLGSSYCWNGNKEAALTNGAKVQNFNETGSKESSMLHTIPIT